MEFGAKLIQLRRERRMTQQELAEQLCVSRQAVSRWEQMLSEPSTENLTRLGKIFSISIDSLVDEEMNLSPQVSASKHQDSKPASNSRSSLLHMHLYLLAAGLVVLLRKWLVSSYYRGITPLSGKALLSILGPLFSFCLITYLSCLALYCTRYCKKYRRAIRL